MLSLRQRYEGCLLGVLAGDALGAPYEKKEPDFIRADFEARGGLVPFPYEDPWGKHGQFYPGTPTDDSEFTAALAQSLIEQRGCVPEDQYKKFKAAVNGQSFLEKEFTHGFGRTTRLMLRPDTFIESQEQSHNFSRATNGSLMRSAPLALFFHNDSALCAATRISSRVTHVHPVAIECCEVFVILISQLLRELEPARAIRTLKDMDLHESEVAEMVRNFSEPPATNKWPPSGGAVHTLRIAVWALGKAEDFRHGIELAVLKGGDSDTAAAVTGALLGAHLGIDAIPAEWQEVLIGRDKMLRLANQLYSFRKQA